MNETVKGWFIAAAERIWDFLLPWLEAKWKEVKPEILKLIKDQFDEWMPKIAKTALLGAAKGGGKFVTDAEDKITDFIPGTLDDKLLDPAANKIVNDVVGGIINQVNEWGFGIR